MAKFVRVVAVLPKGVVVKTNAREHLMLDAASEMVERAFGQFFPKPSIKTEVSSNESLTLELEIPAEVVNDTVIALEKLVRELQT